MLVKDPTLQFLNGETQCVSSAYQSALPFPHYAFDDFLSADVIRQLANEFPKISDKKWYHYHHFNVRLSAFPHLEHFGPTSKEVIASLSSPAFIAWLRDLTGIEGLVADPHFEGGGFSYAARGGYLNMHADFLVHPHKPYWKRRVNLLLYLNEGWQEGYNGHLELWDPKMKWCEKKILPILNRCVIFNTNETSYHGFPEKINAPEGTLRKHLSIYYYTLEKEPVKAKATEYKARPGDGFKALGIYADMKALHVYDWLKRRFGISDQFASNLMSVLRK